MHVMKGEAKSRINQISLHFSDGGIGLSLFKCWDSTISVSDGTIVQGSFFFNASRATVYMKAFVISKVREKIGKNGKKFQKMTLEEEIGRFCYSSLWTTGEK